MCHVNSATRQYTAVRSAVSWADLVDIGEKELGLVLLEGRFRDSLDLEGTHELKGK